MTLVTIPVTSVLATGLLIESIAVPLLYHDYTPPAAALQRSALRSLLVQQGVLS
jgi:hypothetical protein